MNKPKLNLMMLGIIVFFTNNKMLSGSNFQSLTLHPTANPVDPSRKPDPFTITPVVRTM
ncbi:TPA: hypothetical protein OUW59_004792 [Escherichia coli]|nr:hypothetical protein [Escherichia coli]